MNLDFSKGNGLIPAIIQDSRTLRVLMLGYMNQEAYDITVRDRKVTFFSRTRNQLWTKGETSGNFLHVQEILLDCDLDTLLIKVIPAGPVCHTGSATCFNESNDLVKDFLFELEQIIQDRRAHPNPNSYTSRLFGDGLKRIAQKVGEEATEVILEAMDDTPDLLKNETADLLYHLLVLLAEKNIALADILAVLETRHRRVPQHTP